MTSFWKASIAHGKCPCGRRVDVTMTGHEKPSNVRFEHEMWKGNFWADKFWKNVYSVKSDVVPDIIRL
jgi:hypothetical protein